MPTIDAIERPEGVSDEDMEEMLAVDKEGWFKELVSIKEYYAKFGEKLPKELYKELEALEDRLNKA